LDATASSYDGLSKQIQEQAHTNSSQPTLHILIIISVEILFTGGRKSHEDKCRKQTENKRVDLLKEFRSDLGS